MPAESPRMKALRSAPLDSWVALSDDESTVVAVGNSYAEVVQNSAKEGVDDPIVLKTPPRWAPLSI